MSESSSVSEVSSSDSSDTPPVSPVRLRCLWEGTCGAEFNAGDELSAHLVAHVNERAGSQPCRWLGCEHSEGRAVRKNHLRDHVVAAHSGYTPVCEDCGRAFRWSKSLAKHREKCLASVRPLSAVATISLGETLLSLDRQCKGFVLRKKQTWGYMGDGLPVFVRMMDSVRGALAANDDSLSVVHLRAAGNILLNVACFGQVLTADYPLAAAAADTAVHAASRVARIAPLDYAAALAARAAVTGCQRRVDDAIADSLSALRIRQELLGATHPDVATTYHNLAGLYKLKGTPDAFAMAESCYRRALDIRLLPEMDVDTDRATTLHNYALLLAARGRTDEALALIVKDMEVCERTLGDSHPHLATTCQNLAVLLAQKGQYVDARSFLRRTLGIWERSMRPDHPDVAEALDKLAALEIMVAVQMGDPVAYCEALGHLEMSTRIYESRLPLSEKPGGLLEVRLAAAYHNVGYVCAAMHAQQGLPVPAGILEGLRSQVAIRLARFRESTCGTAGGVDELCEALAASRMDDAKTPLWMTEPGGGRDHPFFVTPLRSGRACC
eukprot:Opistho-1_new@66585